MKIAKTKSKFPMVIGIVAGILGMLSGSLVAFVGKLGTAMGQALEVDFDLGFYTALGYAILFIAIAALIFGCIAKSAKSGSFVLFLLGVAQIVVSIVLIIVSGSFLWFQLLVGILYVLGGVMGMKDPVEEISPSV